MERADPQKAARNRIKPRGGFRRKYPALKDQKTCLVELIPATSDRASSPTRAKLVPGPSRTSIPSPTHAQASSVQQTGSVIGQEVEGVIDGTFQGGFLISIKVGEITLKGIAYGMGANETHLTCDGQTVQPPNNKAREVEDPSLELTKHVSSQLVTETVRKVQLRSRIGNSGGGTSSNPTKYQHKDRDGRGCWKGVKIKPDLS